MLQLLWLIPMLPFAGYLVLALFGKRMSRAGVALVGVGSIGFSFIMAGLVAVNFLTSPPANNHYQQTLWVWMEVGAFRPALSFYLDALSLTMVLVVTSVSFLIHFYSVEFMREEEGFSRFFAYLNLFVGSMLVLVLANNLVFLYLGWEGVGLCSYFLIGFWYKDRANVRAARKAFIVTRVGDAALAVGLFLIFNQLGTLDIQEVMQRAVQQWAAGSTLAIAASALLLGGAVGKSAQMPLQTWLPDAMAGPTPVSALIHAATMVTAGVYLIARTHVLFELAPPVQLAVAVVGALTLLMAGCSALTQYDIKRVLAYSTISQIGYMFLALGVGAWAAAIFHFMTHAFFKALLFLGAGVIIYALHHEHNLFKMGGLRKAMPFTFWVFLIGALALVGLPPTSGFASKGLILSATWSSPSSTGWLWVAGVLGAFLTSIYTFRLLFLAFWGAPRQQVIKKPGRTLKVPVAALAVLSVLAVILNWPADLGGAPVFSDFLKSAFPASAAHTGAHEGWLELLYVCVGLAGIPVAWRLTARARSGSASVADPVPAGVLPRFWFAGWGFDWLYDRLFVWPFVWLARANKEDCIDLLYRGLAYLTEVLNAAVRLTQTGNLRWYSLGLVLGAILILTLILFA